ncbi:MAG: hypothetical protein VKI81_07215 [Synechococcaceae cyanobacterium]|nr:hypothetical protein [Synechococcaceae cyanobacterium]
MPEGPPPLHLPVPAQRTVPRPRRPPPPRPLPSGRLALSGLGMVVLGAGLLLGLSRVPERIDAQLLVSDAVGHVLLGLGRFLMGLGQLAGLVLMVGLALVALVLLAGGAVRLVRACRFSRAGAGTRNRPAASSSRGRR